MAAQTKDTKDAEQTEEYLQMSKAVKSINSIKSKIGQIPSGQTLTGTESSELDERRMKGE